MKNDNRYLLLDDRDSKNITRNLTQNYSSLLFTFSEPDPSAHDAKIPVEDLPRLVFNMNAFLHMQYSIMVLWLRLSL